jgi:hypothetical protein
MSLAEPTTVPLEIFGLGAEDNDYCSELKTLTNTDNEQSVLLYEKPGRILNQRLLAQTEMLGLKCLKQTLVEYFDYEVVSKSVWQHIYSWYSADTAICREIVASRKKPIVPVGYSSNGRLMTMSSSRKPYQTKMFLDLFPEMQIEKTQARIDATSDEESSSNDSNDSLYAKGRCMTLL